MAKKENTSRRPEKIVKHRRLVRVQKFIKRADLKANPQTGYAFGDNMERSGYGGQAKEMRDEINAISIYTKRRPKMTPDAFMQGSAKDLWWLMASLTDLARIRAQGMEVVLPADGIGHGFAQLPERAPKLYLLLLAFMVALIDTDNHDE